MLFDCVFDTLCAWIQYFLLHIKQCETIVDVKCYTFIAQK